MPVEGGLYVVDAHKPKPRITITEIGEGNVPTLSPDGRSVLFRKNFNLFVMNLDTEVVTQLTSTERPLS